MRDDLTDQPPIAEETLWETLEYFLHRVLPVAEKAGVKLSMHPDDPPLSPIRGVGPHHALGRRTTSGCSTSPTAR